MDKIYIRCSTEGQDFDQQLNTINTYLSRIGQSKDIDIVSEKVSGTINHTERKLFSLLESCNEGDTIYISELSRLGRSMTDLFNIVNTASEKGITIIQTKDNTIIENKSIGGKALLFALSLASEIEVQNIRQRTKAGLAARKAKGLQIGGTNELWGKNTGTDRKEVTKKMVKASVKSRKDKAEQNPNNIAFKFYIQDYEKMNGHITANTNFNVIAADLNKRGLKTASNMIFNSARAKAMYNKLYKCSPKEFYISI